MPVPVLDICVASYQRPEGLDRLLRSIQALTSSDEYATRISIADNDGAMSARSVCDVYREQGLDIVYTAVSPANIALARNASIQAVDGDWIAIVDDDEVVSPDWLLAYWRAAAATGAQVLHGPVHFEFPPDSSALLQECRAFNMAPELSDGSTQGYERCTTNCFMQRAALSKLPALFNPVFGGSGGEDTDFFLRLSATDTRFGWASDARTTEIATPERMRYSWVTHRFFRFGTNLARHDRDRSGMRAMFGRARLHAYWALRAVARTGLELVRGRRVGALDALLRSCFSTGYVFNALTKWSFKRYW